MRRIILLSILSGLLAGCKTPATGVVYFTGDPEKRKVEVYIDGRRFTDFIYPEDMEKQVLYPIYTASGIEITRGYPMDPRPYERVDHPHHVGMWLNFGDVNGLDFWNNSYAISPERKHRYGTVKFTGIVEQDAANGKLTVSADWVNSGDTVLLKEQTTYIFSGGPDSRTIERTTELTAVTEVIFTENKEGLLGIRMDRAFEEPSKNPVEVTGPDGKPASERILNNEGVNGVYRNAQGDTAGDVWGKRSPWVALRAEKEGETITVAVIDSRANPGYPAWSHARGYGLFAVNNLGGRAFDKEGEALKMLLHPGEKLIFRYKIVIAGELADEELSRLSEEF